MMSDKRIRVLVVDDSALVRTVLTRGLAADPGIEVVGAAMDPYQARDILVRERPDVLTLDVEMPRMDGISFLRKIMNFVPTPVVIVSSLTPRGSRLAIEALEAGAIDVIAKPSSAVADGLSGMMTSLIDRVKIAAKSRVSRRPLKDEPVAAAKEEPHHLGATTDAVIGLGASTGGVAALGRILPQFPAWSPGVVVVQHMPAGFTANFAERLSETCKMRVSEAKNGDRVLAGHILIAPGGDQHLEVKRQGGEYRVSLAPGPLVSGHIPSVDVFFRSLARSVKNNAAACLLTGMGSDGAKGLLELRQSGGRTYAQSKETCAVWGMPAAAVELGAAERTVPLADIPSLLLNALRNRAAS